MMRASEFTKRRIEGIHEADLSNREIGCQVERNEACVRSLPLKTFEVLLILLLEDIFLPSNISLVNGILSPQ